MNSNYSYYSFSDGAQAKVHINLPFLVWELLASDIHDFSGGDFTGGYSRFVNRIVSSYITEKRYPACVDRKFAILQEVKENSGCTEKDTFIQFQSILFENCKNQIRQEFHVPKEDGRKIDLDKNCRELLENTGMVINGDRPLVTKVFDTTGLYIRAILLDYSRQRYDVRCQIYKSEIYHAILKGVSGKRSLLVSFYNSDSEVIIPYGIESDVYHVHSYLVGLYESPRNLNNIALRRFSSIKSVSYRNSKTFLTKEEQDFIKKSISEKKVSYLRDKTQEYVVALTPLGEKKYKDMVFQRPIHLPQTPKERQNHIYRFICSKYQAKNYFRRLGKDAVILSPQKEHDEMLEEYRAGLQAYTDACL